MFDFERLDVYQHVKQLNIKVLKFIADHKKIDEYIKSEWKKASMNIVLNLTEGTGRLANTDKKYFLTLSRSCVFESVAILETLLGLGLLNDGYYQELYDDYEKASKMLLGMYRSYDRNGNRNGNRNRDYNREQNRQTEDENS